MVVKVETDASSQDLLASAPLERELGGVQGCSRTPTGVPAFTGERERLADAELGTGCVRRRPRRDARVGEEDGGRSEVGLGDGDGGIGRSEIGVCGQREGYRFVRRERWSLSPGRSLEQGDAQRDPPESGRGVHGMKPVDGMERPCGRPGSHGDVGARRHTIREDSGSVQAKMGGRTGGAFERWTMRARNSGRRMSSTSLRDGSNVGASARITGTET